jgi:hypothetical protein
VRGKAVRLAERADCDFFVRLHVEDGKEARDLQNVVDALGQMKKLQFALRVPYRSESAHQLADTGAIDVVDIVQAYNDFFLAVIYKLADGFPQQRATIAQRNLAAEIHD